MILWIYDNQVFLASYRGTELSQREFTLHQVIVKKNIIHQRQNWNSRLTTSLKPHIKIPRIKSCLVGGTEKYLPELNIHLIKCTFIWKEIKRVHLKYFGILKTHRHRHWYTYLCVCVCVDVYACVSKLIHLPVFVLVFVCVCIYQCSYSEIDS